jgi:hypothetical protein
MAAAVLMIRSTNFWEMAAEEMTSFALQAQATRRSGTGRVAFIPE